MSINLQQRVRHSISLVILCLALNSCVGTVVGAVVDTTIEVVKVPFKVVGATADLLIPDKDDE
ncbi:MAG: NF038104 family lipoprotein [Proteobacteria bacterium]|nr:NF038104 family lipoprotein [Pseudomonadota bacterium]